MRIDQLDPFPSSKVPFKLASFKLVPKAPGCYVLTTFDQEILYIGLSDNLFNRFQQHLGNPGKTQPTNEGKSIWFYFSLYDPINLQKIERTWLNHYAAYHGRLPLLNKVNSPIS